MIIKDIKIKINLDTLITINSVYKNYIQEEPTPTQRISKTVFSILQNLYDSLQKKAVSKKSNYSLKLKYFEAAFLCEFLNGHTKDLEVYEDNLVATLISNLDKQL